jgi:hypothetical protein
VPGLTGKKILVLYWYGAPMRPAIRHHLEALKYSPARHRVRYVNVYKGEHRWIERGLYDVVILHTTLLCLRWSDDFHHRVRELNWLRDYPALKIAVPQDEYDHSEVLDEWLYHWRVPVILSSFDDRYRATLYPILHDKAHFVKAFTGYIDPDTARGLEGQLPDTARRPLDVVYRAAHLPYSFGSWGQLKHRIAEIVRRRTEAHGLACDLSTRPEDQINSNDWFRFLTAGKATLGLESGSSALDARGQIGYQARGRTDLTFEEFSARMPPGWDDYRFFAIGPRHLEAVYTKTVQILVEGEYDGVLTPGRHYIPLRPDFSNLDDALEQVRDARHLQQIADTAYEEIYRSGRYDYRAYAGLVDGVIERFPAAPPSMAWRAASVATWVKSVVAPVPEAVFPWVRRKILRPVKRALFPPKAPAGATAAVPASGGFERTP